MKKKQLPLKQVSSLLIWEYRRSVKAFTWTDFYYALIKLLFLSNNESKKGRLITIKRKINIEENENSKLTTNKKSEDSLHVH